MQFRVNIEGPDLKQVSEALSRSPDISQTWGPASSRFIEGAGSSVRSRHVEAVLEADSALAAEARVRKALPPDYDYTVVAVEPL
jgi:hypothetical protein